MNKRGQLHIILLLVVAIVISAAALYIFLSFNRNFDDPSQQRMGMINELQFNKNYITKVIDLSARDSILQSKDKLDLTAPFKESILSHDAGMDGTALFFGKIKSNEFTFLKTNNGYEFKMDGMSTYSKIGSNSARSNYNIDITFDNQGNTLSENNNLINSPASA